MDQSIDREEIELSLIDILDYNTTKALNIIHQEIYKRFGEYASKNHRDTYLEIIYELIGKGIITPEITVSNDKAQIDACKFKLTSYGSLLKSQTESHPFFVSKYLNRIKENIPSRMTLDSIIEFYLNESLDLYHFNKFTSSLVMLGIASERCIDLLGKYICSAITDRTIKNKFTNKLELRSAKKRFEEIKKKIDSVKSRLSGDIVDGLEHILDGFFTLLRKFRNEFGHPTGAVITKDECLGFLQTFPQYLRRIYDLILFFDNNPI